MDNPVFFIDIISSPEDIQGYVKKDVIGQQIAGLDAIRLGWHQ